MSNLVSVCIALLLGLASPIFAKELPEFHTFFPESVEIRASFAKLKPLTNSMGEKSELTVYRGVARANLERPPTPVTPKANDVRTVIRLGETFFKKPMSLSAAKTRKPLSLVKNPQSFSQWGGAKACGGFHPDYALVWKTGDLVVEMHLCFTCKEIKVFNGQTEIYCEIEEVAYQGLKDWTRSLSF
jgi:hypothetical protein